MNARLEEGRRGIFWGMGATGVDLVAPDWRDVDLDSLALGLARIPRFLGQTRRGWTIAEHSVFVAGLARTPHPSASLTPSPARGEGIALRRPAIAPSPLAGEGRGEGDALMRLAALTHDAHEGLIGDLVTPLPIALEKRGLIGAREAIAALKRDCDHAIARAIIERVAQPGTLAAYLSVEQAAAALAITMRCDAIKAADELALTREWESLIEGQPDCRIIRKQRNAGGRAKAWLMEIEGAARAWLEGV